MRIAYISADRGIPVFGSKGASIHIREMINAFAALGNKVTIFSARRGPHICPLAATLLKVRVATGHSGLQLEGDDRRRAQEQYSIDVSAAICEQLVQAHAARPFDVIYERYALFSTAGVRAAQRIGVPCLLEVNSPLVLEQQKFRRLIHVDVARSVEREVFGAAAAVLAVSEQVRAYAEAKGAVAACTYVLPNGVDTDRFHPGVPAAAIDRPGAGPLIGFVGSLKPWHGIEILLHAFRDFARRRPDAHLLIVGDGPLRGWIEGYMQGAGLSGNVTVTGWAGPEQLPGLIRAMDVAVAPYPDTDDFYFSPLKLYEYLAMGVAIVASRLGQVADVIVDGENGLLTRAGDAGELSRCIERLADDAQLRNRLGRAAAHSARELTWKNNARRALDIATSGSNALRSA